jgi:hypothetical protein
MAEHGSIVFVLCEFQLVDETTEASNERGEASHERYKERQMQAVKRRLKIGTRALRSPGQPDRRASDRPTGPRRRTT